MQTMFKVGDVVKVVRATDETTDLTAIGKVGEVTRLDIGGPNAWNTVGQSASDPFIWVRFYGPIAGSGPDNGQFWSEELKAAPLLPRHKFKGPGSICLTCSMLRKHRLHADCYLAIWGQYKESPSRFHA
jgi:hypothetical protein